MLIGEDVVHGRRFASVDPSSPTRIVAHAHEATAAPRQRRRRPRRARPREVVEDAPPTQRAAALHRAADILRSRRLELAALAVREAGKPWAEADGDVCEAIDFLVYYAAGRARARRRQAADPDARRAQQRCATSPAASPA